MIVREATMHDLNRLVELGRSMFGESKKKKYNFNDEKLKNVIHYLIKEPSGIVFVAVEKEEIIGGFVGNVIQHWYGDDTYSTDFALYITPEKRGGIMAMRMLKRYIAEAKKRNVDEICIGTTTGIETEMVERLYERMGFERDGSVFSMKGV